jgi:hypothetical protein
VKMVVWTMKGGEEQRSREKGTSASTGLDAVECTVESKIFCIRLLTDQNIFDLIGERGREMSKIF